MFPASPHTPKFSVMEEDTLRFWKTHHIFEKAAERCQGGLPYRAIPLPPSPVHPPVLQAAVEFATQDVYLRYKTMRGYRVTWVLGWNAHGLPVELGAETRLGLAGPSQVAAYGLNRFHELCRRSAFDYLVDWERLAERVGAWSDWEQAPANLSNEQIEACWGALKTLWERKLLYQEERAAPYCPRCATPLGSPTGRLPEQRAEQSQVLLRLPLVEDTDTSLLVWTDRPWALPGNVAVAANPETEYVIVEHDLPEQSGGGTEKLILARQRVEAILGKAPIRIFEHFRGTRLKGLRYRPLFTYILPDKPAYQVVLSEMVGLEPGTGLAQISPHFAEQARLIAQTHALPVLQTVTGDGTFVTEIRPWRGLPLRQAAPRIIQDLQQRGLVLRAETHEQSLPVCPVCGSTLIEYATRSWYLGSTSARHRLASLARAIDFHPLQPTPEPGEALLTPRGDWPISRKRNWGTPLPIWDCRKCKQSHVIGSLNQLAELVHTELTNLDLHLPALDMLELTCPDCGEPLQRVPGVLDTWFELGRMALGRASKAEAAYEPPDLACAVFDEPVDWLMALHLLSGLLYDQPGSRQVLWLPQTRLADPVNPHDERLTPLALLREHGADALRWAVFLQPVQEALHLSPELLSQVEEDILRPAWSLGELLNSRIDLHLLRRPVVEEAISETDMATNLDNWLHSRLHSLVRDVTTALEAAETRLAVQALQAFILDDLSGWYVPLRLSPPRLKQQPEMPLDAESYRPLFDTLGTLSRLLAPLTPFLAEGLYQNLARGLGAQAGESVHLSDWPTFDPQCIRPDLEADMLAVRRLAKLGQTARQQGHLPRHQPLAEAAFALQETESSLLEAYASLLAEDLNVRSVRRMTPAELDEALADERRRWVIASANGVHVALTRRLTPELVSEGLAGEFVLRVLELRQKAGLAPQEHIRIVYSATARLAEALEEHRSGICAETQAEVLQAFSRSTQPRQPDAMKGLFTISEFSGEKVTFGIEKV